MLTEQELELRVLHFTRTTLVAPEMAAGVTADTRLFEERVIDSLKILELIAFVEAQLGRRIPDAQVVLANFRTIRAMVSVFAGSTPPTLAARRKPRVSTERIFEHSTGRTQTHPGAAGEMVRRGEIEELGSGEIRLHDSALMLSSHFDGVVREWAAELGATETDSPEAIEMEALERAGFVAAFPQKLVMGSDAATALSPAVCYHSYPRFAGRIIENGASVTTAIGRCFREERDDEHPLERLRSFTMREIIVIGEAGAVTSLREGMIQRVSGWLKALELDGFIEPATDPFFTSETRGRMLAQQILPLKYELRLAIDSAGRTIAAASFNDHQSHFGRAFDIRLPDGEHAHSGCVAFGWERWVIAFISQHGPDARNWPDAARSAYATVV